MNRRAFLADDVGAPLAAPRRDRRPNIVFVITDDLRYDALLSLADYSDNSRGLPGNGSASGKPTAAP